MQTYITSYCHICEAELSFIIGTGLICGNTHIECKSCGTLNKTNDKPFSQMSKGDKLWAILNHFVFDIVFIVPLFIIILFIAVKPEPSPLLGIAVFVFFGYNGYKVVTLIDMIPKIEKEQERIDEILKKQKS